MLSALLWLSLPCQVEADAFPRLEAAIARKPKEIEPFRKFVKLLRDVGRDREIEPKLDAFAAAQPENSAIRWVQVAELARRDFASADVRFKELLTNATEDDRFELLVATYSERNRAAELLRISEEFFPVRSSPLNPLEHSPEQATRRQAFAKALVNDTAIAMPILKAARIGRERSAELWELLDWIAARHNLGAEYEAALETAAGRTAFELRANHLFTHRKWQKLLDFFGRSNEYDVYKSRALAELGRGDEALATLRETRKLANYASRRQTAVVFGLLGRHEEMLKTLDAMKAEFADRRDQQGIQILRADALLSLNRIDEMESVFRAILEEDPDDVLALNNLGYNLADQNRKLPEAELLIRRAVELDREVRLKRGEPVPESGVYLDSLGWVLFRRGNLKAAREQLERAADLPDGHADAIVWDHLGDVCFRLGDKPAAKKSWQLAIEKYTGDHRGQEKGRQEEAKRKLKLVEK